MNIALKPELERRGHTVNLMEFTSGLHILRREGTGKSQLWQAGADPRREGVARGD